MSGDRQRERHPTSVIWREAHGGLRGSLLLATGAALLGLAAAFALATADSAGSALQTAGWLTYVVGLGIVGLAFAWTCIPGVLPRAGLAVAVLCVAQAAHLLFILCARSQPFVPPVALAVGRQLTLLGLAVAAAARLGRGLALSLAVVAVLGLGKLWLRSVAPRLGNSAVLDAIALLLLAAVLTLIARRLRRLEDDWARCHHPGGRADFSAFNNPQHEWNRPGRPSGLDRQGSPR